NIRGHIWYLRQVRRAYRPKTPEGAANSSYVHFLFGLIFKYEATTEQGHRSQGPNDTARSRRRGDRMKRRDFITLLGGAAAAWPLAARAQQPGKLPTIGFLGTTDPSTMRPWITAFVERLRDLGWIEDRTIAIAYRWAEGHPERYAEIAAEFVRLNVNVIVTTGPAAPHAKARRTTTVDA